MRPQECLRVQGIGRRNLHGIPPNKIREMVGNSMHVGTVSAVVRAAFKTLKSFEMSEKIDTRNAAKGCIAKRADYVSVAAARIEGIQDPGGVCTSFTIRTSD